MSNPLIDWMGLVDSNGINLGDFEVVFNNGITNPISSILGLLTGLIIVPVITLFAFVMEIVSILTEPNVILNLIASFFGSVLGVIHKFLPPVVLAGLGFAVVLVRYTAPRITGFKGTGIANSIHIITGSRSRAEKLETKSKLRYSPGNYSEWYGAKDLIEGGTQACIVFFTILFLSSNPIKWLIELISWVTNIGKDFGGNEASQGFMDVIAPLLLKVNYGGANVPQSCDDSWIRYQLGGNLSSACKVDASIITPFLAIFFAIVLVSFTYYLYKIFLRGSFFLVYTVYQMLVLPYRLGWELFKPDFGGSDKKWYDKLINTIYETAIYLVFFLLCVFLMTSVPVIIISSIFSIEGVDPLILYLIASVIFWLAGKNAWRIAPKTETNLPDSWTDLKNNIFVQVGDENRGRIDVKKTLVKSVTGKEELGWTEKALGRDKPREETAEERLMKEFYKSEADKLKDGKFNVDSADNIKKSLKEAKRELNSVQKQKDSVEKRLRRGRITENEAESELDKINKREKLLKDFISLEEQFNAVKDSKLKIVPIPEHLQEKFGGRKYASAYAIEEKLTEDNSTGNETVDSLAVITDAKNRVNRLKEKISNGNGTEEDKKTVEKLEKLIDNSTKLLHAQSLDPQSDLFIDDGGVVTSKKDEARKKKENADAKVLNTYMKYHAQQEGLSEDTLPPTVAQFREETESVKNKIEELGKKLNKGEITQENYDIQTRKLDERKKELDNISRIISLSEDSLKQQLVVKDINGRLYSEKEHALKSSDIETIKMVADVTDEEAHDISDFIRISKELRRNKEDIINEVEKGNLNSEEIKEKEKQVKDIDSRINSLEELRKKYIIGSDPTIKGLGTAVVRNPDYDPEDENSPMFIDDKTEEESQIDKLVKETRLSPSQAKEFVSHAEKEADLQNKIVQLENQIKGMKEGSKEYVELRDSLSALNLNLQRMHEDHKKMQEVVSSAPEVDTAPIIKPIATPIIQESPEKIKARALYTSAYNKMANSLMPVNTVASTVQSRMTNATIPEMQEVLLPATVRAVQTMSNVVRNSPQVSADTVKLSEKFLKEFTAMIGTEATDKSLKSALATGTLFLSTATQELSHNTGREVVREALPSLINKSVSELSVEDMEQFNVDDFSLSKLTDSTPSGDPVTSDAELNETAQLINTKELVGTLSQIKDLVVSDEEGLNTLEEIYRNSVSQTPMDGLPVMAEAPSQVDKQEILVAGQHATEAAQANGSSSATLPQVDSIYAMSVPGHESDAVNIVSTENGVEARVSVKAGFES